MQDDLRRGPLPVFGSREPGLHLCVRLTLAHLRHNLAQELLVDVYGVSQATASRVIAVCTPLIAQAPESSVTVRGLDPAVQLIVDGPQGAAKSVDGWGLVSVVWVRWFRSSGLGRAGC